MERLATNFRSLAFGPDAADQCTLRLVIGPDGLTYAVRDKNGEAMILRTWHYPPKYADLSLRKVLHQDEAIAYPYGRCELFWQMPLCTFVPKRMFDPETAKDYLKTLTDQPVGEIFVEETAEVDAFFIGSVNGELAAIARYFAPQAFEAPLPSRLVRFWQNQTNERFRVFAHLRSQYVQIAVFDRNNLLAFNTFSYEKPADVLYYTLLLYDQFALKPTDTELTISGELLRDSEIYRQYERFIRHIRFAPSPTLIGIPEAIPPHVYLDQTMS